MNPTTPTQDQLKARLAAVSSSELNSLKTANPTQFSSMATAAGVPVKPVNVPTITPNDFGPAKITPPMAAPSIAPTQSFQSLIDEARQFITKTNTESQLNAEKGALVKDMATATPISTIRQNAYDAYGIQNKVTAVNNYANQLADLERQANEVQAKIETQYGAGEYQGFIDSRANAIRNKINIQRNDIATSMKVSQNDLNSAMEFVDRAVADATSEQKQRIDARKEWISALEDSLQLEENRNNKAISYALDETKKIQEKEEKKLEEEKQTLKDIRILALNALQNGASEATISKIRSAKTVDEAISIGGRLILEPKASSPSPKVAGPLTPLDIGRLTELGYVVQIGDTLADAAARNRATSEAISSVLTSNAPAPMNVPAGKTVNVQKGTVMSPRSSTLYDMFFTQNPSAEDFEKELNSLNL